MNKTITAIKRGVKAGLAEIRRPRQFKAGDKLVVCSHCGADGFQWYGFGMAETRHHHLAGGFVLECCQCSLLVEFGKKPVEIETED